MIIDYKKAFIFVILTIFLFQLFLIFFDSKPFYYFDQDVETDYFFSGMLIANGFSAWSFHHPGVILQNLIALILYNFYLTENFSADEILSFSHLLQSIIAISILLLITLYKNTLGYLGIATYLIMLAMWPSLFYYSEYLGPDLLILPLSAVLILSTYSLLKEGQTTKHILVISICGSIGISLKLSVLPILLVCLGCIFLRNCSDFRRDKTHLFNLFLIPILIFTTFLILNIQIYKKLPFLILNTFFSRIPKISDDLNLILIFGILLFITIYMIWVLLYFDLKKYKLVWILKEKTLLLLFFFLGSSIFFLDLLRTEPGSIYELGLSLRNNSASYPFIPLIAVIAIQRLDISYIKISSVAAYFFLCTYFYFFQESRDNWIFNKSVMENEISLFAENLDDKPLLIWTGSGDNNFLEEIFFMWGDFRYSEERFDDEIIEKFKNIHMLRLRTLTDENDYYQHNNQASYISRLTNTFIHFPDKAYLSYGDQRMSSGFILILAGEIQNELGYSNPNFSSHPVKSFKELLFSEYGFKSEHSIVEIGSSVFDLFEFSPLAE